MKPRSRNLAWLAIGIAVMVVLVVVLQAILTTTTTSTEIRRTQQENTAKAAERDETLQLVQKAVEEIAQSNRVAAAAASACALAMPKATFDQVYACTIRNVDQASVHPKP